MMNEAVCNHVRAPSKSQSKYITQIYQYGGSLCGLAKINLILRKLELDALDWGP
jgi:hypothetical protein